MATEAHTLLPITSEFATACYVIDSVISSGEILSLQHIQDTFAQLGVPSEYVELWRQLKDTITAGSGYEISSGIDGKRQRGLGFYYRRDGFTAMTIGEENEAIGAAYDPDRATARIQTALNETAATETVVQDFDLPARLRRTAQTPVQTPHLIVVTNDVVPADVVVTGNLAQATLSQTDVVEKEGTAESFNDRVLTAWRSGETFDSIARILSTDQDTVRGAIRQLRDDGLIDVSHIRQRTKAREFIEGEVKRGIYTLPSKGELKAKYPDVPFDFFLKALQEEVASFKVSVAPAS